MILDAFLKPTSAGRFTYADPAEADAGTLDDWLSDAAGGITIELTTELDGCIDNQNGGRVYKMIDESAAQGYEVSYIILWEKYAEPVHA